MGGVCCGEGSHNKEAIAREMELLLNSRTLFYNVPYLFGPFYLSYMSHQKTNIHTSKRNHENIILLSVASSQIQFGPSHTFKLHKNNKNIIWSLQCTGYDPVELLTFYISFCANG